ncbi:hypothetical protein Taro_025805 [Colocasia esculenta]|uniref:Uncharacterized protein n=1 Tax=Colocasia esculenta TaxID=4460 RepID=A0A843VF94_COLES|nr:hypothetical protein [Colocasia esculenta]
MAASVISRSLGGYGAEFLTPEQQERFTFVKTKVCGNKAVDVADLEKKGMHSIVAAMSRMQWMEITTFSEVSYPDLVKAFYVCLRSEADGSLVSYVKGTQIKIDHELLHLLFGVKTSGHSGVHTVDAQAKGEAIIGDIPDVQEKFPKTSVELAAVASVAVEPAVPAVPEPAAGPSELSAQVAEQAEVAGSPVMAVESQPPEAPVGEAVIGAADPLPTSIVASILREVLDSIHSTPVTPEAGGVSVEEVVASGHIEESIAPEDFVMEDASIQGEQERMEIDAPVEGEQLKEAQGKTAVASGHTDIHMAEEDRLPNPASSVTFPIPITTRAIIQQRMRRGLIYLDASHVGFLVISFLNSGGTCSRDRRISLEHESVLESTAQTNLRKSMWEARDKATKTTGSRDPTTWMDYGPVWLRRDYLESLCHRWATGPWQERSEMAKRNRATHPEKNLHNGGSVSYATHNQKLETYDRMMTDRYAEGTPQPDLDPEVWVNAAEGPRKGRVYGFGDSLDTTPVLSSYASLVAPPAYTSSSATPPGSGGEDMRTLIREEQQTQFGIMVEQLISAIQGVRPSQHAPQVSITINFI